MSASTERCLKDRIKFLSKDVLPESFPPENGEEDLARQERRKAEAYFEHALCRRTWWRLSAEERSAIRHIALQQHPSYAKHPDSGLEMACLDELRRLLRHTVQSPKALM